LCNSECGANEPAAQAGHGKSQAIGNFILCKVLKGNAARPHSVAAGGTEGGELESLVYKGQAAESWAFDEFSDLERTES
jgi:hypothetical protein